MNERPNPSSNRRRLGFLSTLKSAFRSAAKVFGPMFQSVGDRTPTRNEMHLDADEWAVKRKLGRSYFTRRLNPNTRVARIASLNEAEYELARNRGWV